MEISKDEEKLLVKEMREEFQARIEALEAAERTRQIEQNFEEAENGIGSNVSYGNGPFGEL